MLENKCAAPTHRGAGNNSNSKHHKLAKELHKPNIWGEFGSKQAK